MTYLYDPKDFKKFGACQLLNNETQCQQGYYQIKWRENFRTLHWERKNLSWEFGHSVKLSDWLGQGTRGSLAPNLCEDRNQMKWNLLSSDSFDQEESLALLHFLLFLSINCPVGFTSVGFTSVLSGFGCFYFFFFLLPLSPYRALILSSIGTSTTMLCIQTSCNEK